MCAASADRVGDCVVFDIRHNRYRLIAKIYYGLSLVNGGVAAHACRIQSGRVEKWLRLLNGCMSIC
jgi:hypothetical protein